MSHLPDDAVRAAVALYDLRKRGWRIAVHNDYLADDHRTEMVFIMMVHPASGKYTKAYGLSDLECLQAIAAGHP